MPSSWERLKHSAFLLGYALCIALVLIVELIAVQAPAADWLVPDERGVPVLNNWAVFTRIWVPYGVSLILSIYGKDAALNAGNSPDHWCPQPSFGRKLGLIYLVIMSTCFLLPLGLVSGLTDLDAKYYALDQALLFFGIIVSIIAGVVIVVVPLYKKRAERHATRRGRNKNNDDEGSNQMIAVHEEGIHQHQQGEGMNQLVAHQREDTATEKKGKAAVLLSYLPCLLYTSPSPRD